VATRILPLFPLNAVLVPGMLMPLQIFEDRYRQMLRDCQVEGGEFGVVLIREGPEVGGTAEPHEVGTLAKIQQSMPTPDGRYLIQTQGVQRFRILRLIHDRAYLRGEVELFKEARANRRSAEVKRLMAATTEAYKKYLDLIRKMGGQVGDIIESALDPEFLSWLVTSTLLVPPQARQELLEIEETVPRLRRVLDALLEINGPLEARAERSTSVRGYPFSLN